MFSKLSFLLVFTNIHIWGMQLLGNVTHKISFYNWRSLKVILYLFIVPMYVLFFYPDLSIYVCAWWQLLILNIYLTCTSSFYSTVSFFYYVFFYCPFPSLYYNKTPIWRRGTLLVRQNKWCFRYRRWSSIFVINFMFSTSISSYSNVGHSEHYMCEGARATGKSVV